MSREAEHAAIRALAKNGTVEPADLIRAARDPKHPCHHRFTWDITQAAAERWHDQARAIIREVKFEVIYEEVTHRAVQFVGSQDKEETHFVSVPQIRRKGDKKAALLAEVRQLLGIAARVHGLAIALHGTVGDGVVKSLADIRKQIEAVKSTLE